MDEANKDALEKYKLKCILRNKRIDDLPTYAKEIKLAYLGTTNKKSSHLPKNSVSNDEERGICQLQTITIEHQNFTIFYDSGCGDFTSKWSAIQKLGTRAHQKHSGPINVDRVGGLSTESPFGIYSVNLPLHNGRNALLSGGRLAKDYRWLSAISTERTSRKQHSKCIFGIRKKHWRSTKSSRDGWKKNRFHHWFKYLRYHPQKIFQMPSGLTIYKFAFKNPDESRGVVGCPHKFFRKSKGIFI